MVVHNPALARAIIRHIHRTTQTATRRRTHSPLFWRAVAIGVLFGVLLTTCMPSKGELRIYLPDGQIVRACGASLDTGTREMVAFPCAGVFGDGFE